MFRKLRDKIQEQGQEVIGSGVMAQMSSLIDNMMPSQNGPSGKSADVTRQSSLNQSVQFDEISDTENTMDEVSLKDKEQEIENFNKKLDDIVNSVKDRYSEEIRLLQIEIKRKDDEINDTKLREKQVIQEAKKDLLKQIENLENCLKDEQESNLTKLISLQNCFNEEKTKLTESLHQSFLAEKEVETSTLKRLFEEKETKLLKRIKELESQQIWVKGAKQEEGDIISLTTKKFKKNEPESVDETSNSIVQKELLEKILELETQLEFEKNAHKSTLTTVNNLSNSRVFEIEQVRKEITLEYEKIIESLKSEIENKRELISSYLNEITRFKEQEKYLKEENEKLQEDLHNNEISKNNLKSEFTKVCNEAKELKEKLKDMSRLNYKIEEIQNAFKSESQSNESENFEISTSIETVDELNARIKKLENDTRDKDEMINNLNIKLSNNLEEIKYLKIDSNDKTELENQLKLLKEIHENELNTMEARVEEKTNNIIELNSLVLKLKEEISNLKTQLSTTDHALNHVSELKDELEKFREDNLAKDETIEQLKEAIKSSEICLNEKDNILSELRKSLNEMELSRLQTLQELDVFLDKTKADFGNKMDELNIKCEEVENLKILLEQSSEKKEEEFEKMVNKLNEEKKTSEDKILQLKYELEDKNIMINELDSKIQELDNKLLNEIKNRELANINIQHLTHDNEQKQLEFNEIKENYEKKIILIESQLKHNEEMVRMHLKQIKEIENEKNGLLKMIDGLSSEINVMKNEHEKALKEFNSILEKENKEKIDLIEKIEEIKSLNEQKSSDFEKNIKDKLSFIDDLNLKIQDLLEKDEENECKVSLLTQKNNVLQSDLNKIELECKEKDEKIATMAKKIERFENNIEKKDNEMDDLLEKFHTSEDKLIYKYKKDINLLETELSEKNLALEEVHEYYHLKLKEKEDELKSLYKEFDSSSINEHSYQVKAIQKSLLQYQEENLRLKELLEIRNKADTSESVHLQESDLPGHTEYEYLKNIVFEFMMGRDPLILAKVISAVLRFSKDQTDQIVKRQESVKNLSIMPIR